MSAEVYQDGILRESWNDFSRTVIFYNTVGAITSTRPYTAAENATTDADAFQDAQITALEDRVSALENYVFATMPPNPDGVPWSESDWAPGSVVTHNGKKWRNDTGVWLNGNYLPGDLAHPFWTELPGESEVATPWVSGMALTTNQLVTNGGNTYRYLGTNTASAPANWAPTVSNATWLQI